MPKHESHKTRMSDASTFDEICVNCGATDQVPGGWGQLAFPCPKSAPPEEKPLPCDCVDGHRLIHEPGIGLDVREECRPKPANGAPRCPGCCPHTKEK